MTIYGYARVSRGRDDGTGTLQNQRLRSPALASTPPIFTRTSSLAP